MCGWLCTVSNVQQGTPALRVLSQEEDWDPALDRTLAPLDGPDDLSARQLESVLSRTKMRFKLGLAHHRTGFHNALDVIASDLGCALGIENQKTLPKLALLHTLIVGTGWHIHGVTGLTQFIQGSVFHFSLIN